MSDESNLTGKKPWYLDAMEVSKRQKAAREARETKQPQRGPREPARAQEQPARAAPTREQIQERAAANRARDAKAREQERGRGGR